MESLFSLLFLLILNVRGYIYLVYLIVKVNVNMYTPCLVT